MNTRLAMLLGALVLTGTTYGLPEGLKEARDIDMVKHTIPAADLALINRTEGATGFYVPTGDFTPLDLDSLPVNGTDGAIERRDGTASFAAFTGWDCTGKIRGDTSGFRCGVCVKWNTDAAYSMRLSYEVIGRTKPTASVFANNDCKGNYQSIGIGGTQSSCTNTNGAIGRFSAILYYGC